MTFDPKSLDLAKLFVDPKMFDSRDKFRAAGFKVFERSNDDKIMVASHEDAKGYLFKKYSASTSMEAQLENHEKRVKGARKVQELIEADHLEHVVVPQKYLHELPREFSRKGPSHVLIVERLSLMSTDDSKKQYRRISEDVLRDLCTVFFSFPGLDSVVDNVPFTKDGKIAFIDTEHWERRRSKWKEGSRPHMRHIDLSRDREKFAKKVFKKLGRLGGDE